MKLNYYHALGNIGTQPPAQLMHETTFEASTN